jgi:hypothetical protein
VLSRDQPPALLSMMLFGEGFQRERRITETFFEFLRVVRLIGDLQSDDGIVPFGDRGVESWLNLWNSKTRRTIRVVSDRLQFEKCADLFTTL